MLQSLKEFWKKNKYFFCLNIVFIAVEFSVHTNGGLTIARLYNVFKEEQEKITEYGLKYNLEFFFHPFVAFFIQMIAGAWSDRCKCKIGRRKPFLIAGSLISILSQITSASVLIWNYCLTIVLYY